MLEGHQLNPTGRFSSRVEDYRRFRPGYPAELLDILKAEIGFSADWTVADIGSGTGLLTELFLRNGNPVCAVEPNEPMRAAGEAALGGRPGFTSVAGSAEATTLPDAGIDLIAAGQAFHWFEPRATAAEWRRIARGRGWAALIWNVRDVERDPLMRELEALIQRHAQGYERIVHRDFETHLPLDFFTQPPRILSVPNIQSVDEGGFLGRLFSSSYLPGAPGEARERMAADARELFSRHSRQGRVELVHATRLILGSPLS